MQLRPMILRFTLVGLIVTVVAGGAGMLLNYQDTWGKIILSVIATVIALGLVVALAFLIDRPHFLLGSLSGILLVTAGWVLALVGLWVGMSWGTYEAFQSTLLAVGLLGVPFVGLLMLDVFPALRPAVRTFAVVAGITLLLVIAELYEWVAYRGQDLAAYAAATLASGTVASICLLGARGKNPHRYRYLGLAFAVVSVLGIYSTVIIARMYGGISDVFLYQFGWRTFGVSLVIAALVAHDVLLRLPQLSPRQEYLRLLTRIAGRVIAALVYANSALAVGPVFSEDLTAIAFRIVDALVIATGCATLALFVLWGLNRRARFAAPLPAELRFLELTCPSCGVRAKKPAGPSACDACGLRFAVHIEEPRCATCGYLLFYHTASTHCPECGTAVATSAGAVAAALAGADAPPSPAAIPPACT